MRTVCAPDSFKGSLTAAAAAEAMARGVRRVHPDAEIDLCPVADGGEGTARTLVVATGGSMRTAQVADPLGRPVVAEWGWLGGGTGTAVVEMAAASGLTLLAEHERDPLRTSTRGTGELIRCALDAGARRIVLAIGGSATNDGGCGAAQALGVRFLDASGQELPEPITGGDLRAIHSIDVAQLDPRLAGGRCELLLCCDVDNPLTGPQGAAAVYGPQKGAGPRQVELLDAGLTHLGRLWRDELGRDVSGIPGAGAAGGMGGGMMAMLGASLRPGIELVLEAVEFERRIAGADLCLTGEGRLDGQSLHGKACFGVSRAAQAAGVETIGIVGSLAEDAPDAGERAALGMVELAVLTDGVDPRTAMQRAAELVEELAARTVRQR